MVILAPLQTSECVSHSVLMRVLLDPFVLFPKFQSLSTYVWSIGDSSDQNIVMERSLSVTEVLHNSFLFFPLVGGFQHNQTTTRTNSFPIAVIGAYVLNSATFTAVAITTRDERAHVLLILKIPEMFC